MKLPDQRCPLMDETVPVLHLSNSHSSHRTLPGLATCRECPVGYSPGCCPLRNNFNTQLQFAILAVLGEYQLRR